MLRATSATGRPPSMTKATDCSLYSGVNARRVEPISRSPGKSGQLSRVSTEAGTVHTSWRDPAIVALNPNINIPDETITVVHRSDGSGTAYIFSNYLSSVDPTWASEVGTGKTLHWPVGVAAAGNPGVAQAVSHIPFSIGYIERSYRSEEHTSELQSRQYLV